MRSERGVLMLDLENRIESLTILSHARAFPPQHSTSVMGTLLPGVAYRRSRPRKPEFPMFPP
ncbi:MAG: hypothetical protein ACK5DR_06295, partial [Planctomyces sp.]